MLKETRRQTEDSYQSIGYDIIEGGHDSWLLHCDQ